MSLVCECFDEQRGIAKGKKKCRKLSFSSWQMIIYDNWQRLLRVNGNDASVFLSRSLWCCQVKLKTLLLFHRASSWEFVLLLWDFLFLIWKSERQAEIIKQCLQQRKSSGWGRALASTTHGWMRTRGNFFNIFLFFWCSRLILSVRRRSRQSSNKQRQKVNGRKMEDVSQLSWVPKQFSVGGGREVTADGMLHGRFRRKSGM